MLPERRYSNALTKPTKGLLSVLSVSLNRNPQNLRGKEDTLGQRKPLVGGFYVTQEVALHFLDSRIVSTGDKSGANGKG
jgi:hypothetical protein